MDAAAMRFNDAADDGQAKPVPLALVVLKHGGEGALLQFLAHALAVSLNSTETCVGFRSPAGGERPAI
jgi:hypothetical protein